MTARMRIGMVAYGDLTLDSRVQREARSLAEAGHEVTLYCLAAGAETAAAVGPGVTMVVREPPPGGVIPGTPSPFRDRRRRALPQRVAARVGWLVAYARQVRSWGRGVVSVAPAFDVWHLHDFTGLIAVAPALGPDARIVYDVHDLFVETGSASQLPKFARRLLTWYERHLTARVELAVAVNAGLGEIFARRCRPRRMIVVHNCPPRHAPPASDPRPDLLRQAAQIDAEASVILYHGMLGAQRGLEMLCEAMLQPGLERAHLALLGFGDLIDDLRARAADPRFAGRIHVLDAVPPTELLSWVASADVGAMALPNATINLYISTPNKLFECLAVGTPVVVSDFPAVRAIVGGDPDGPLGAVCDPSDVSDIARAIVSLLTQSDEARADLRRRCIKAAYERWNWEAEAGRLVAAYEELGADGSSVSTRD